MRSSFLGLEVSKRTIQLSQKALDVTGGNLSNSKTEGYTRQVVDVGAKYLNKYEYWQTSTSRMTLAGQGAVGIGVDQVRDPYIDKRYRESTPYVAEYSTSADILREVETVLDNITTDGLTASIDEFKKALSSYAERPDSEELASIVRNSAYNLTNLLHTYHSGLEDLKMTNLESLQASLEDTNNIIDRIVNYNKSIVKEYTSMAQGFIGPNESVTGSYGPNEMLDERNLLLDELSYKFNIRVYDNADGSVRVVTADDKGNETEIINGEKYEHIYMKGSTKTDDDYDSELERDYYAYNSAVLRWTSGADANHFVTGELQAYTNMLNGNGVYKTGYQNDKYGIPYYESAMDSFAHTFANYMNYFNGAVDENGKLIDKDRLMFCTNEFEDPNYDIGYEDLDMNTSNIRIAKAWMENATMVGETYDEKEGKWSLSLDGDHINQFTVKLKTQALDFGGKGDYEGTVYDYLLFISNRIGQNIDYFDNRHDAAFATSNALLDSRDAVSGVSETEEGINMLTYQNWYNASARLMTALDDALDRLINNTGRVGL
ncbi:MAG: flagellar hook-associated protein FlgK [Ruminiclostridium sp.]|nr:flagellar hook-associated protein FlgK [Ruminiclostridium sp.]